MPQPLAELLPAYWFNARNKRLTRGSHVCTGASRPAKRSCHHAGLVFNLAKRSGRRLGDWQSRLYGDRRVDPDMRDGHQLNYLGVGTKKGLES